MRRKARGNGSPEGGACMCVQRDKLGSVKARHEPDDRIKDNVKLG